MNGFQPSSHMVEETMQHCADRQQVIEIVRPVLETKAGKCSKKFTLQNDKIQISL